MKQSPLQRAVLAFATAVACGVLIAAAQAADKFPSRPVRMIVPYSPGGATDIVARQVAQRLSDYWGYQVVVDNRAGGSGAIALETVARATADGYTLMVGNVSTNAIAESAYGLRKNAAACSSFIGPPCRARLCMDEGESRER